jgi:RNA polymerase sigma-70 factor (ECF subfamily)
MSESGQPCDTKTQWLVKYEPWMKSLARMEIDSRFGGKFSASDAVQQTMLEAWRGWDGLRGETEAQRLAWLRQVLAHQLAHLARRFAGTKKRDVAREVSLEQSLARSSARLGELLAGTGSSPSQRAVHDEQSALLAAVLGRLPEDYREVIVLRNVEGLSHEEIARRMERSPGAVRMLWVRALGRLREDLGTLK